MNYHGASGLIVKDSGVISRDRYGLDAGSVVYQYRQDADWGSRIPAYGSAHPYAAWMKMEKVNISVNPGFVLFTCEYAGVNGSTEPVYDLEVGTAEEPIETHPKFVTSIGGTHIYNVLGGMSEWSGPKVSGS